MNKFWIIALFLLAACAKDRSATSPNPPPELNPANQDTTGLCTEPCDASPPSVPTLDSGLSWGDITTYGNVTQPKPSAGGACNYGPTEVYAFAAIQVHQLPGDLRGQWQGGKICGQCVEVSLRSPEGWKSTVVRIMDKCPDAHCGVDLAGAPAKFLMGEKPGRYSGKWAFVSCAGHSETSDGLPALFVKEGSNAYWSLVQVRNAAERILQIRMRLADTDLPKTTAAGDSVWTELTWATEAENFFKVPFAILQDPQTYEMQIILPSGPRYLTRLKGSDLAAEMAMHPLSSM